MSSALGPTRPDKLTIWPVEDGGFGIDVLYVGARGYSRAETVHRQLCEASVPARFDQQPDGAWTVRLGPVDRDAMLTVLNGFVW